MLSRLNQDQVNSIGQNVRKNMRLTRPRNHFAPVNPSRGSVQIRRIVSNNTLARRLKVTRRVRNNQVNPVLRRPINGRPNQAGQGNQFIRSRRQANRRQTRLDNSLPGHTRVKPPVKPNKNTGNGRGSLTTKNNFHRVNNRPRIPTNRSLPRSLFWTELMRK